MLSNSKLALAWLCVMLLLAVALGQQLFFQRSNPIETNILALLPENRQDPIAQQAFDHVANSMSNKVIFLIGSNDADQMLAAADTFDSALQTSPLFAKITAKVPVDTQQAWGELYFPNRFQLLTTEQKTRLTQHPEQQTQFVIQSLYNPFSGVTGQELASDPFLLFRDYLSQLTKQTGNFSLSNGYLTTKYQGKQYVLISADLADSPYSYRLQQQLPELLNIEQGIRDTFDIELLHTGVVFYAEHGTESAKSEISTIGVGSLVGVILLLLLVYLSPLPLALALLSIGCGLLAAFVGTVAIFGKVHLFSLVFGASLIGVSIDYAFHFLTDRLAAGECWNANKGLKQIFTAITLGLITSLIGYLGMLIAPFPGLQQLSLFSAIGLIAAYATVVCWYPVLAAKPSQSRPLPLTQTMHAWLALWQQPLFRKCMPAALLSLALVGLYHVEYNDDIRQLQALPQDLKQQEDTIKAITGLSSSQQMLVVTANDQQQLLQNLESVSGTLTKFKQQGVLKGFQSISQYLPSENTQQQNYDLIKQLYQQQATALAQALPTAGQATFDHDFSPLTVEQFIHSPVSEPLRFLWLGKLANQQQAAIIMLSDVSDIGPIVDFAEHSNTVSYLNKADEVSSLFGEYRVRVTELLIAASLVIMGVLWWRYGFTRAVRLMLPPVIAGIVGIGVTSLTGVPLNLFNLLALILILGIGIDYTLFFAEQHQADATLLSITLSAMTTLLSFGLLALSQTQAIHSFGITVLTGIMVAWLLAPLSMASSSHTSSTKEHKA
ncbi:MMPL family transporter [Photobacterium sanguinicancri]|uniref:MMPL family transporter n=2 Tax=Photobacterium sanguinicancri TaxID=875932 RepID=A0AAW7XYJ7_9GAMM|nr:MMPL family transporter [Photobacterium sanguinicancri]MDO6541386.1 MMPL family transporter [Photobacterium sanguinicancri]